jgi:hypothetical protein
MLLRRRATAGRKGLPLPLPSGRPEEDELKRIADQRAQADKLRKKRDRLIVEFLKLGVGISDRGWFGDSRKRLALLEIELEEIDKKIQEIGQ